jgi:hypothetical protein
MTVNAGGAHARFGKTVVGNPQAEHYLDRYDKYDRDGEAAFQIELLNDERRPVTSGRDRLARRAFR